MSNSKHTPGPWSIYFNSRDDLVIRKMFTDGQESHSIARCHSGAANALLIAAAPDMLAALQGYVDAFEHHLITNTNGARDFDFTGHIAAQARAAIAKATGDTK